MYCFMTSLAFSMEKWGLRVPSAFCILETHSSAIWRLKTGITLGRWPML